MLAYSLYKTKQEKNKKGDTTKFLSNTTTSISFFPPLSERETLLRAQVTQVRQKATLWAQEGGGATLFNLLLGAQVVGVAALLLATVDSTGSRHNTCSRSPCLRCASGWAGRGRPAWCSAADEAPTAGWTLSECCSLKECSHPPAVCPPKPDTTGQAGWPPCLGF